MKHSIGYNVKGQTKPASGSHHRFTQRDERHIVRLRARARQPLKDIEVSVIVSNLSRSGCKIESLISLDPKAPVLITYQDYPSIRAQIMWTKTGSHGCKFEKPIPDNVLEAIINGA